MQLASDEESVQSLNVEDSADHSGKKRSTQQFTNDCRKPHTKAITESFTY